LHIRVRQQVVADGLDKSLDWQKAGYDMPPLEWHAKVKEAREKKKVGVTTGGDIPLILDCRNNYETSVGRFEGAEPLETENFRESWDVLKSRLADTPKDSPIMTYCTGGIRCVKVGAYLTQELGFTNVSRLAGGIIAYDRTLNEKAQDEEPMFKGTNFVFDGRMGREITDDGLAECITCGEKTSLVTNCKNNNCHKRMIQCEKCRTSYMSTCSDACKQRVLNGAMVGRRKNANGERQSSSTEKGVYRTLDEYSTAHSSPPQDLYGEIERNTEFHLKTGAHMVSGAAQGRLLTQLSSMTRSGRILELGTFTGYATACFLEGAAKAGEALSLVNGNRQSGPFVMTLERDSRAINLAASHLKIMSEFGIGPKAAEESQKLRGESNICK
jgi:predicted sulfurtransferase